MLLNPLRLTPEQMHQTIEDRQASQHCGEENSRPESRHENNDVGHQCMTDEPIALIQFELARLKIERKWMHHRAEAAYREEELRLINKYMFQLHLEPEGHKQHGAGQKRNTTSQGASELPADSLSTPKPASIPSFMTEYLPAPEPGSSNPNDGPDLRRCIIGQPTGMILQSNSVAYHRWKCNKHRSKELFEGNMNISLGLPERDRAWKCA
jgi:hypothetical protein